MAYIPIKGHTLLIPSGPSDHLHIVLTGISSALTHLLVNFSSIKAGVFRDPACLVAVGEHKFIQASSYIAYEFGRIEFAQDLTNRVDSNVFQVLDPVSPALLDRIRAGISTSSRCPKKFQRYFVRNEHNA